MHNPRNTLPKKKNYSTHPPQILKPKLMGDMPKVSKNTFKPDKVVKKGKLDGQYWVWPSGTRTHLRFIKEAVMKMRPLPMGFYAAAKKANLPNLNVLVAKAKSMGLKEIVDQ